MTESTHESPSQETTENQETKEQEEEEEEDQEFKELRSYTELVERLLETISSDQQQSEMGDDEEDDDGTTTIIKLDVNCRDVEDTFTVRDIKIVQNPDEKVAEVTIYYTVCHLGKDDELKAQIEIPDSVSKIEAIFDIFWKYKLCPECLQLIKKEREVCENCVFHKMRQQFGMKKGYISEFNTCPVCQENVYHTRLQCGHFIHHTCLINLNPFKNFRRCEDIKCPVCRRVLSHADKNRFFIL